MSEIEQSTKLDLERIVFIGRTFEEYMDMFLLSKEEVRIFPLVDLEGKRYKQLDKILSYLAENEYSVEEVKIPYEFQANANSMLIIKKGL